MAVLLLLIVACRDEVRGRARLEASATVSSSAAPTADGAEPGVHAWLRSADVPLATIADVRIPDTWAARRPSGDVTPSRGSCQKIALGPRRLGLACGHEAKLTDEPGLSDFFALRVWEVRAGGLVELREFVQSEGLGAVCLFQPAGTGEFIVQGDDTCLRALSESVRKDLPNPTATQLYGRLCKQMGRYVARDGSLERLPDTSGTNWPLKRSVCAAPTQSR